MCMVARLRHVLLYFLKITIKIVMNYLKLTKKFTKMFSQIKYIS